MCLGSLITEIHGLIEHPQLGGRHIIQERTDYYRGEPWPVPKREKMVYLINRETNALVSGREVRGKNEVRLLREKASEKRKGRGK